MLRPWPWLLNNAGNGGECNSDQEKQGDETRHSIFLPSRDWTFQRQCSTSPTAMARQLAVVAADRRFLATAPTGSAHRPAPRGPRPVVRHGRGVAFLRPPHLLSEPSDTRRYRLRPPVRHRQLGGRRRAALHPTRAGDQGCVRLGDHHPVQPATRFPNHIRRFAGRTSGYAGRPASAGPPFGNEIWTHAEFRVQPLAKPKADRRLLTSTRLIHCGSVRKRPH